MGVGKHAGKSVGGEFRGAGGDAFGRKDWLFAMACCFAVSIDVYVLYAVHGYAFAATQIDSAIDSDRAGASERAVGSVGEDERDRSHVDGDDNTVVLEREFVRMLLEG